MEPGPVCTDPQDDFVIIDRFPLITSVLQQVKISYQPCDWHPRIDSVVYHGMDWNCPSYTKRLGEEIQKHWGNITPELLISEIIAKVTTNLEHLK